MDKDFSKACIELHCDLLFWQQAVVFGKCHFLLLENLSKPWASSNFSTLQNSRKGLISLDLLVTQYSTYNLQDSTKSQ